MDTQYHLGEGFVSRAEKKHALACYLPLWRSKVVGCILSDPHHSRRTSTAAVLYRETVPELRARLQRNVEVSSSV